MPYIGVPFIFVRALYKGGLHMSSIGIWDAARMGDASVKLVLL